MLLKRHTKMTTEQAKRDRIAEFMKVARQRYSNNPAKWRRLYALLHELLPTVDAERLEAEWVELDSQEAFEDWDEKFMQATIEGDDTEEGDEASSYASSYWSSMQQQMAAQQHQFQQQLAAQQLAAQQQQYRNSYNYTATTTSATGTGHRGFWTRIIGGKE